MRRSERPQHLLRRELFLEVGRSGGVVEAETTLNAGFLGGGEEARGGGRGGEEEEESETADDGEATPAKTGTSQLQAAGARRT